MKRPGTTVRSNAQIARLSLLPTVQTPVLTTSILILPPRSLAGELGEGGYAWGTGARLYLHYYAPARGLCRQEATPLGAYGARGLCR